MSVTLIDDHEILTLGLAQGLRSSGLEAKAAAPTGPTDLLDHLLGDAELRLVVLDFAMPQVPDTPALVRTITDAGIAVIVLSGSDDQVGLASCLVAGAISIISKNESVATILDTIQDAYAGRPVRPADRATRLQALESWKRMKQDEWRAFDALTAAEAQVLELLMAGRSAADIAADRFVSLPTVRTQIKSVLSKLGVSSQLEAVSIANRIGFRVLESN